MSALSMTNLSVSIMPFPHMPKVESDLNSFLSFISGPADSVCTDVINKWLCVFLPSTNCTVPENLKKVPPAEDINRLYLNNTLLTEKQAYVFKSAWNAKPSFDFGHNRLLALHKR